MLLSKQIYRQKEDGTIHCGVWSTKDLALPLADKKITVRYLSPAEKFAEITVSDIRIRNPLNLDTLKVSVYKKTNGYAAKIVGIGNLSKAAVYADVIKLRRDSCEVYGNFIGGESEAICGRIIKDLINTNPISYIENPFYDEELDEETDKYFKPFAEISLKTQFEDEAVKRQTYYMMFKPVLDDLSLDELEDDKMYRIAIIDNSFNVFED